jgi:hypothetical protein
VKNGGLRVTGIFGLTEPKKEKEKKEREVALVGLYQCLI